MIDMERFLTTKEVAGILNLPLWKVQELIRVGDLPVITYSRRTRRIAYSVLQQWVQQRLGCDLSASAG